MDSKTLSALMSRFSAADDAASAAYGEYLALRRERDAAAAAAVEFLSRAAAADRPMNFKTADGLIKYQQVGTAGSLTRKLLREQLEAYLSSGAPVEAGKIADAVWAARPVSKKWGLVRAAAAAATDPDD